MFGKNVNSKQMLITPNVDDKFFINKKFGFKFKPILK